MFMRSATPQITKRKPPYSSNKAKRRTHLLEGFGQI